MDDGRVSYEEAAEAIREAFVKVPEYYRERRRQDTIASIASTEDVARLLCDDVITGQEARRWCSLTNHTWSDIERELCKMALQITEDTTANNSVKRKKPWPHRLVAFLNEVIDMFIQAITEDFL